jgi:hypothetical protein
MDNGPRAVAHEGTLDRRAVADVQLQRAAVRRRRVQLRREHIVAALDGLAAELRPEVAGTAGDEELCHGSRMTVCEGF